MRFSVDLQHTRLGCLTPTDPGGEDDPYLWVFLFKLDGSTLRQRNDDPRYLTATVSVTPGSTGRPGNVGGPMTRNQYRSIVPPFGVLDETLRPITLDLKSGGTTRRFHMPGSLWSLTVAIDEESSPRDPIEAAFSDMRANLEADLNAALIAMDIAPVIAASGQLDAPGSVLTEFHRLIAGVVEARRAAAIGDASAAISLSLLTDGGIAGRWADALDAEEPIGASVFSLNEEALISTNLRWAEFGALQQPTTTGRSAYYLLSSTGAARIVFGGSDIVQALLPLPPVSAIATLSPKLTGVTLRDRRCAPAGTVFEFVIRGHVQRQVIRPTYPFLSYRFLVNGTVVPAGAGSVAVAAEATFPRFNESAFYFVGATVEPTRQVTLRCDLRPDPLEPQIPRLILENDPNDGNFIVDVAVEAVLPDGTVLPVGTRGAEFAGQTLEFTGETQRGYNACIAAWLKSKGIKTKLTLDDLRRPGEERWQEFETMREKLAALREIGRVDERAETALTHAAALRLGVMPEALVPVLDLARPG